MSGESSDAPNRLRDDPPPLVPHLGGGLVYLDSDTSSDFSGSETSDSEEEEEGEGESWSDSDEYAPDLYVQRFRKHEAEAVERTRSRRTEKRARAKAASRRLQAAREQRHKKRPKTTTQSASADADKVAAVVRPASIAAALSRLDLLGLLRLSRSSSSTTTSSSSSETPPSPCHASVCLLSHFDSDEKSSGAGALLSLSLEDDLSNFGVFLSTRCCPRRRHRSHRSHSHPPHVVRLHARCLLTYFLACLLQKKNREKEEAGASATTLEQEEGGDGDGEEGHDDGDDFVVRFACPFEGCGGFVREVFVPSATAGGDSDSSSVVLLRPPSQKQDEENEEEEGEDKSAERSDSSVDVKAESESEQEEKSQQIRGRRGRREGEEKQQQQQQQQDVIIDDSRSRLSVLADHRERKRRKRSNLRDMERLERVRGGSKSKETPAAGWQRNVKKISKRRERELRRERRRKKRELAASASTTTGAVDDDVHEEEGGESSDDSEEEEETEEEVEVTFLSLGGDAALERMRKRLEGLRLRRLREELLKHNIPVFQESSMTDEPAFRGGGLQQLQQQEEEGEEEQEQEGETRHPLPLFASEEDPKTVGYVVSLRERVGVLRSLAGKEHPFPLHSVSVPTLGYSGDVASVVRFWLKPGDKVAFELVGVGVEQRQQQEQQQARNVALIERPSEEERRRSVRTRLIQAYVADQESLFEGIVCEIVVQEAADECDLMYVAVGGEKVVRASIPKSPADLFRVGDVVVFGLVPKKAEYLLASSVSIKPLKKRD